MPTTWLARVKNLSSRGNRPMAFWSSCASARSVRGSMRWWVSFSRLDLAIASAISWTRLAVPFGSPGVVAASAVPAPSFPNEVAPSRSSSGVGSSPKMSPGK